MNRRPIRKIVLTPIFETARATLEHCSSSVSGAFTAWQRRARMELARLPADATRADGGAPASRREKRATDAVTTTCGHANQAPACADAFRRQDAVERSRPLAAALGALD